MQGPGHGRVQLFMASLLATLVLDDDAMEAVRQRGEGPLVFEAALKLVSATDRSASAAAGHQNTHGRATTLLLLCPASSCALQLSRVLGSLKSALAASGAQILAEGLTQAGVQAAMQQMRVSSTGGADASPLMQAAARRLSQEATTAAVAGAAGAAAARRLSGDASATAAAMLQEARQMRRSSCAGEAYAEPPEPLGDVDALVLLAEACAQAMWGSAHYSLEGDPLPMRAEHVSELGRLALECLMMRELKTGRICHCIGAYMRRRQTRQPLCMPATCSMLLAAFLIGLRLPAPS